MTSALEEAEYRQTSDIGLPSLTVYVAANGSTITGAFSLGAIVGSNLLLTFLL